jgi:hypothetical protein
VDARDPAQPEALGETVGSAATGDLGDVPRCCVNTIHLHARHNPMMVCSECKQIIKCFADERSFQNYLTFCRSRRRPVLTGRVEGLFTVVFRSYETSPVYGNR